jgi:hypothetical protein
MAPRRSIRRDRLKSAPNLQGCLSCNIGNGFRLRLQSRLYRLYRWRKLNRRIRSAATWGCAGAMDTIRERLARPSAASFVSQPSNQRR